MSEPHPSSTAFDTNVWFGRWPFLAGGRATVENLEFERARHGITRMFVSPFDALLSEIPDDANDELGEELEGEERLEFVPVVNPTIPHWLGRVDGYRERYETRWLRIAPSYHHYSLSPVVVDALASCIAGTGLLLSLQMRMDDERNQNPILDLKSPAFDGVFALAARLSPRPLLIHNLTASEIATVSLTRQSNILVDIAFAESFHTMTFLTDHLPASRLVLGSNFPLFSLGAAIAKVVSWNATSEMKELVLGGNIGRTLPGIPPSVKSAGG